MRYELNIHSEPFETDSEFAEESETLDTELADWEWEEEAGRRRRPRPAVSRAKPRSRIVSRAKPRSRIVSTKRLIKSPFRPPIRPPVRPPRSVIFPTFPLPAVSVAEPRPPKPPAPAGAEPADAAPAPAGGSPTPPSAEPSAASAEPSAEGSEHVRWVQSSLNQILGLRLPVDGIMDAATRSAVRSFQQREGLPVDGIVGPDTERALIAARSGKSPQASAPAPAEPGMMKPSEPGSTPPPPGMMEPSEPAPTSPAAEFDFEWESVDDEFEDAEGIDEVDLKWLGPQWDHTLTSEITNPTGGVAANRVLKRAGLKTTTRADKKTPVLIQTALEQSLVLRPFIATKLAKITIAKNFFHYGPDPAEFNYQYLKLHKIVIPSGSKEEKDLLNIRGFYHRPTDSIHLRQTANVGDALPLAIHKFSSPAFYNFFGNSIATGLSLYFANLVLAEQGLVQTMPEQLRDQLRCATDLAGLVGLNMAGKAYFENHLDLRRHLKTNLSIGPVRDEELAGGALCKTPLLPTARFASHQVKNMVGVGITGPRRVRLWMRTDVPGMHELQILGGSRGTKSTKIMIQSGQRGDKTMAITYPQSPQQPPLDPLTKYRYRIVRTSDGTPLGEGSFETSPAGDGDTPKKVVIAVMSYHQPFTDQGTIAPESARMLRLLPRILQENDVKFVLPCGDQMYADDPGIFSLFNNPYLIRQTIRGKTSICYRSPDEVRRLYDMRYRTFWSMIPIRKMYANYPCYPAMDDHEIKNSWGTNQEHSGPRYRNILRGALDAYFDYQASSVLPPMTRMPSSFHYHFSYGNIGIFVMDIRSERFTNSRNQMYSEVQLNDLRQFLLNNGHKKALFIVASVPVVFVPGGLADIGARLKPTTFHDHWSHGRNIPARDALLSLLHTHQQTHPKQRVAIISGDVHIGNAFVIRWRGGNNPRLYQFTSSAITARESRTDHFLTSVAPRLVSSIDCRTRSGGLCSGEVSHLPAAKGASSHNPFVGLNLGLIEVQRYGDVSNLKFKLIGYHPKEERPVTFFESGWLG